MHDNESADHFVPPEPPPIKIDDPIKAAALIGVVGAPILFVLVGILVGFAPIVIGTICVLVFCASFVVLVVRAKNRAPHDDGWDDGAVL